MSRFLAAIFIIVVLLNPCKSMDNGRGMVINVFAGEDRSICFSDQLDLSLLEATISGDVTDGTWFSYGDGKFLPEISSTVRFSEATYYQPGPGDRSSGQVRLVLVSDDPDGFGPMVEVSDEVIITLMSAPPMVCNNNLSLSLPDNCQQLMDVHMLLSNPHGPADMYEITLYDDRNRQIPDNIVTSDHIGTTVRFVVGHSCSSNTCSGVFSVSDNIAPALVCQDITIDCRQESIPDSVGLPIPYYATYKRDSLKENGYIVYDLDGCGDVHMTYSDQSTNQHCTNGVDRIIERSWEASDPYGNVKRCKQTITVNTVPVDSIELPQNYDDINLPSLPCDGDWLRTEEGYPHPDITNGPTLYSCKLMEILYEDVAYDKCGASFKIVRKWDIFDWCTGTKITHHQIIAVTDKKAPEPVCPSDITIGTDAYNCTGEMLNLKAGVDAQDCSDWDVSFQVIDSRGLNQSQAYIQDSLLVGIPMGVYTIQTRYVDACNNDTTCERTLVIEDRIEPFAICDKFTKVSISDHGGARLYAYSLDDESYDNCAIETMEVAKMADACNNDTAWKNYVDFCCSEVGATVMVQFRVTDKSGNSNTCMVEVTVEDKLPPQIVCPSDLTISCETDIDPDNLEPFGVMRSSTAARQDIIIHDGLNNGVAGRDGYFTDNCGATISEQVVSDIECGRGTVRRTFVVTDNQGLTNSCTQTITVQSDQQMDENDIVWPTLKTINDCGSDAISPEVLGKPTVRGEHCSQVESTYEDQVFDIAGDACRKILRKWSVIDWCQYDQNTGEGLWENTQVIKITDETPPEIETCEDVEVCDYDDCDSHELKLSIRASDACTDSMQLFYRWRIDQDNNGSIDYEGEGSSLTQQVTYGEHKVYWMVEDACGNIARCDYIANVKDCKLPTPYCLGSISAANMPSTGELEIKARDFNLGSTDNCTAESDLVYTFSRNTSDTTKILTCADIADGRESLVDLDIWVTDLAGNQDYCSVQLRLQDNDDVCEDGVFTGSLSGNVATSNGYSIANAKVTVKTPSGQSYETTTDENGRYTFNDLENGACTISVEYTGGGDRDVNTLDLVFLQRHILRLKRFDNPYNVIAGDVTNNKRVQASDLFTIKKQILDLIGDFPKSGKWRFVNELDETNPLKTPIEMTVDHNGNTTVSDITAVRMGNVNDQYSFDEEESISRSEPIKLRVKEQMEDGHYVSQIIITDDMDLHAAQWGLDGGVVEVESEVLSEDSYAIQDGVLRFAHMELDTRWTSGEVLATVRSTRPLKMVSHVEYESFVYYDDMQQLSIDRVKKEKEPSYNFGPGIKVYGNPISMGTDIRFQINSPSENVRVELISQAGEVLNKMESKTNEPATLTTNRLSQGGLYFLRIIDGADVYTKKVLIIE